MHLCRLGVRGNQSTAASISTQTSVTSPVGAPDSIQPPPSRLDAIRSTLTSLGFGRKVAKRVAQAGRSSTNIVYDAKWKLFADWCTSRHIDPLGPTGP